MFGLLRSTSTEAKQLPATKACETESEPVRRSTSASLGVTLTYYVINNL